MFALVLRNETKKLIIPTRKKQKIVQKPMPECAGFPLG
jgi:hypothetical protein